MPFSWQVSISTWSTPVKATQRYLREEALSSASFFQRVVGNDRQVCFGNAISQIVLVFWEAVPEGEMVSPAGERGKEGVQCFFGYAQGLGDYNFFHHVLLSWGMEPLNLI